jgi:hypothetical protein
MGVLLEWARHLMEALRRLALQDDKNKELRMTALLSCHFHYLLCRNQLAFLG